MRRDAVSVSTRQQDGGRSSIAPTSELGLPSPLASSTSVLVADMVGHNSGSGTAGRAFVGTPVGRSALGVTIRQSLDGKWMGENSMLGVVICTP